MGWKEWHDWKKGIIIGIGLLVVFLLLNFMTHWSESLFFAVALFIIVVAIFLYKKVNSTTWSSWLKWLVIGIIILIALAIIVIYFGSNVSI